MTLRSTLLPDISRCKSPSRTGGLIAVDVVEEVFARIEDNEADATRIYLSPRAEVLAKVRHLAAMSANSGVLSLYGVPFAFKDNIDVTGHPTTAGCPEFGYTAHATAVGVSGLKHTGERLSLRSLVTCNGAGVSAYGALRSCRDT